MFSPGPSNLLSAAAASRFGLLGTVPFVIGMDLMVLLPALAVGYGLVSLISISPALLHGLQIAGVAFIVFLAISFWRAEPHEARAKLEKTPGVLHGALVQFANIKGLVLLLLVYSQFLDMGAVDGHTVLVISLALTALSLVSHFSWAFFGDLLSRFANTVPAIRMQNRIYAVLLCLTSLWILLKGFA
nr:LysE family translocator [Roseibium litorale]